MAVMTPTTGTKTASTTASLANAKDRLAICPAVEIADLRGAGCKGLSVDNGIVDVGALAGTDISVIIGFDAIVF
ncbi:MAG: hypothetical protein CTY31_00475 [Hyphomicrobium sp.]|nr:MAG: hypothetical protein CTY31_00475 [Hyphomicrobium sp.]